MNGGTAYQLGRITVYIDILYKSIFYVPPHGVYI